LKVVSNIKIKKFKITKTPFAFSKISDNELFLY